MIDNRNTEKLADLLRQDRKLFHIGDLGLLWGISNRDTLRQTIARYIKKGTLIQIHRGFYSILPLNQIEPFELGTSLIHSFCYVSTETVLVLNGIIFQQIMGHTLCSSKSMKVKVGDQMFYYRKLADRYLFNPTGVVNNKGYKIATVERAVADMQYFNPLYYFDGHDQINWDLVSKIKKEVYGQ